jgi:hypothetical protein
LTTNSRDNRTQIDTGMTMMIVFHDAFRRDLGRLGAFCAGPATSNPPEGWRYFKQQLIAHHALEDSAVWPTVARAVADRPGDANILRAMELEHEQVAPALAAVDDCLARDHDRLVPACNSLISIVGGHLSHEEREALPLVAQLLGLPEFAEIQAEIQAETRVALQDEIPGLLPWLLDEATPYQQQAVLDTFPVPVQDLYREVWFPNYQLTNPWEITR